MARSLWFIALLSAFFVVAMRLAGLPLAVACAADDLPSVGAAEACDNSHNGSQDDVHDAVPPEVDDDGDEAAHGAAPLMAPPIADLEVPVRVADSGRGCGALAEQFARSRHVPDLDRPPRG